MIRKLNPGDVRRTCDPASLGFESTEALEAPLAIIGQNRALKALQFGLQIQNSGFNIYAAGLPGTGKMTAITGFLERLAKDKETPGRLVLRPQLRRPVQTEGTEAECRPGGAVSEGHAATD